MLKLLKYLLPLIVVAAISAGNEERVADVQKDFMSEAALDAISCQDSISETESDLCLPRQITSGTSVNFHNTARRTTNVQRSALEFIKAGKLINTGVSHLTRNTIIVQSALYEPVSRLFAMGRLII